MFGSRISQSIRAKFHPLRKPSLEIVRLLVGSEEADGDASERVGVSDLN